MTVSAYIGGASVGLNVNKVRFTKCMNSEPQPATIDAWGAPEMLVDFNRDKDGDDAVLKSCSPWTKESGDDGDGTDIVHEIDVTSDVHSLYVKDASATAANTFDISYTFPTSIVTFATEMKCRIKIQPVTSLTPASHLFIYLLEGATQCIYLKIDLSTGLIYYSDDAGATWTSTTQTATLDTIGYIWLKLGIAGGFELVYSSSTTAPTSWGTQRVMSTSSNAIDGIRLISPATAHGYEAVTAANYGGAGGSIKNTAYWSNWDANGRGTFVEASGWGRFTKDVAAAWSSYPVYTFGTAQPAAAAGSITFKLRMAELPTASYFYVYYQNGATPQALLRVATGGTLQISDYTGGSDAYDTLLTLAVDTTYTITFTSIDSFHYDIVVNGTTYDNAGAHFEKFSGRSAAITNVMLYSSSGGLFVVDVDDIVTSWATAGPDVDPVEAYIYEIWSDQTIDFDDVLDEEVNILIDGKHAWRGYVCDVDMVDGGTGDDQYTIMCRDVMQPMVDQHCNQSFLLATYTVNGAALTDDRIDVDEAPDVNIRGYGAIIALNPSDNVYTADADSLKSGGEPTLVAMTDEGGAHTDTQTANDTFQVLKVSTSTSHVGTATYVLTRAHAAETPVDLKIRIKGKLLGATSGSTLYVSLLDSAGTEGPLTAIASLPSSGSSVEAPIDTTVNVVSPATYCYEDGANWEVTVKFTLKVLGGSVSCWFYLDKLRAELTARDEPFEPIEAQIYNVDAGNKYIYVNAKPWVSTYLHDGDLVKVGTSINNVQVMSTLDAFENIIVQKHYRWLAQDMAGHTWFDVWKHCCNVLGGYYYWQLDEDSGRRSLYHVKSLTSRDYYNSFFFASEVSIVDYFPEWTDEGSDDHGFPYIQQYFNTEEAWSLRLLSLVDALETQIVHVGYNVPTESTGVTMIEFPVWVGTITGAVTVLQVKLLDGDAAELYDITWDANRKPTFTGPSGNSGVIDHAWLTTDYVWLRMVLTATTVSAWYKDPGDDAWTAITLGDAATITSNDIAKITLKSEGGDLNAIWMMIGEFHVRYDITPTSTAITIKPMPKKSLHANSVGRVVVKGKHDDYEVVVDATKRRDIIVADDSLVTSGAVRARAEFLADAYTSNTRSVLVEPLVGNTNYQVGDFYEIAFNGGTLTGLVLRRAEFQYDAAECVESWALSLDTGSTTGHELVGRLIADMQYGQRKHAVSRIADD